MSTTESVLHVYQTSKIRTLRYSVVYALIKICRKQKLVELY